VKGIRECIMKDVFEAIVRIRERGGSAVLATVVAASDSSPRGAGAKMLIEDNGTVTGTVGGGTMEDHVRREALQVMAEGQCRMVHYDGGDATDGPAGMACGGRTEVFLEPVSAPPTLYVFGGGHISFFVVKIAAMVGFRVVVADDRADYATRERFPDAAAVMAADFAETCSRVSVNRTSCIVIATSTHAQDEAVLQWALKTDARYIGMVGSTKKREAIFTHLRSQGVTEDRLDAVHSPIGLNIGAETPEEIAVSIMAEIITVRRTQ